MNFSKEYLSFLEAHRQSVELKDKMKQAALIVVNKKLEDSIDKNPLDRHKEIK